MTVDQLLAVLEIYFSLPKVLVILIIRNHHNNLHTQPCYLICFLCWPVTAVYLARPCLRKKKQINIQLLLIKILGRCVHQMMLVELAKQVSFLCTRTSGAFQLNLLVLVTFVLYVESMISWLVPLYVLFISLLVYIYPYNTTSQFVFV